MNLLRPGTVLDIGANIGAWSLDMAKQAPFADYFLFEANRAHRETLMHVGEQLRQQEPPNQVIVGSVLLGAEERALTKFYVVETPNSPGASIFPERTDFQQHVVNLPMTTLDTVLQDRVLKQPVLMKLDVQGAELEVLKGAEQILRQVDTLHLEVSLLNYNEGAPLFHEVVAFLAARGFVLYEFEKAHLLEDGTLLQADATFLRFDHPLRSYDFFRFGKESPECPS